MGSIYFPGANDNASGIAMLLSLAQYYSGHRDQIKIFYCFYGFSGEEIALLGSKYYTEHPLFPLSQIRFLINMDIMGTGDEGITVVNGTIYKKAFDDMVKINNDQHLFLNKLNSVARQLTATITIFIKMVFLRFSFTLWVALKPITTYMTAAKPFR